MLVELETLKGVPANKAAAIPAPNAEMAPLIQCGDRLIIELDPDGIVDAGIYILNRQGYITIRRFVMDDDGNWLLVTEDLILQKNLREKFVERHDKIVARVCGAMKVFI